MVLEEIKAPNELEAITKRTMESDDCCEKRFEVSGEIVLVFVEIAKRVTEGDRETRRSCKTSESIHSRCRSPCHI